MRRLGWTVIVALVGLDTGAGSYLWWLLDHKPPRVAFRAERSRVEPAHPARI